MRQVDHFVNGTAVAGAPESNGGRFGDIFDPNTGRVQARVALASRAEVDAAVARPWPPSRPGPR